MMSIFDDIPRNHYGVILADPPWSFKTWSDNGKDRAAENHYDVMSIEDIYKLPVGDLAEPDCALFLWSINPMQPEAFECIRRWGFTYKTVAFTWAKRARVSADKWHIGLGYWTRQNTERCLLATRGKPTRFSRSVRELIVEPVGRHSAKPDRCYTDIEELVDGPYLELFARRLRPGWDAFGNEIGGFVSSEERDVAA